MPACQDSHASDVSGAGSTQGIGYGMLQGLAKAGADVVMHGLVTPEDARQKQAEIEGEFGVKCGHSAADVMKPAEIRYQAPPQ
jgi:NAD(P)-dependent dehydrogenase (short-subunit alcohol dehydrogenase family)